MMAMFPRRACKKCRRDPDAVGLDKGRVIPCDVHARGGKLMRMVDDDRVLLSCPMCEQLVGNDGFCIDCDLQRTD